jgi:hypothetical protein
VTPDAFRAKLASLGLTQAEAARQLEITSRTIRYYLAGTKPIGRVVELALEALEMQGAVKELCEGLRPFAEACEYLHPSMPDDAAMLDGFKYGDFRRARALIAKHSPSPAEDGRETP